ncbi:MAG TPA: glycoside hydrolase family 3 N-terminal domain-containing protein [Gemmatimonadaceae bacterium]|nr:glycoside hydrolase family 3 N-terminal domain-containing protein [Gemmatimonadaceae bacterium]
MRAEIRKAAARRVATLGACLVGALTSSAVAQRPAYRDASLPIERRITDLLSRMTLEEKVAQMMCLWDQKKLITSQDGRFDPAKAPRWFRVGIGRIERPQDGHDARGEAEFVNAIQRWVRDSTRLGIPILFNEEALHGLEAAGATSFPQAIALASTWNTDLVQRVFTATAAEARARGVHQVLAPVVDIAREPRWGRFEETYGEDPFLVARMGVAAVRGFQGTDSAIGAGHVFATLKHMTGHGQPESGTNVGPASIGERTLRDMFLYPFETAIKEAGAKSVMASYNEVDGIPSHVNRWMLHDVLRTEWGFDGTVVSDWFAIQQLIDRHHVASDPAEAARRALDATVDIELPDPAAYATLVDQVKAKTVSMRAIDAAVRRLLRPKFMLGLFENPFVDVAAAERISGAEGTRALALEAAQQAMILLRNQGGLLPLRAGAHARVAVIGPHAGEVLLGGYAGVPLHAVSILEGIRARVAENATVEYAEGVRITEDSVFTKEPQPHMGGARSKFRNGADRVVPTDSASNARRIADAVALAQRSDLVVLVLGDNEQTAREAYENNHLGDRSSLGLPGDQERLALQIAATAKPVVLVLINGRPASIPNLATRIPAILEGWYLGQETGTAVAKVLFGDVNPGGKLPVTVARDVGQVPVFYNYKPSARRGYVLDTIAPLYPFGFGLSYTTFAYSNLRVSAKQIPATGRARVSVDVRNTGSRAGDEVVQLYIRDEVSNATRPVKELRGFQRVSLAPGETRTVSFDVGPEHLSYHGAGMKRVVEPGTFQLMVGGSSADLQSVSLVVSGTPSR